MLALLLMLTVSGEPEVVPVVEEPPIDWNAEFGLAPKVRDPQTGEYPVAPYEVNNENAGAEPFSGDEMAQAFGGQNGIRRIADRFVDLNVADRRLAQIFAATDTVRFRRTLFEQFCYILNAGCNYTGRDMRSAHFDVGSQQGDMNAIVENLQQAMREQGVSFRAQNRFLSKLAPMSRDIIVR